MIIERNTAVALENLENPSAYMVHAVETCDSGIVNTVSTPAMTIALSSGTSGVPVSSPILVTVP